MFNKIFKHKIEFHCEMTGKKTTLDNTVVLVKINGIAVLKNFNNPKVDFDRRVLIPIDKPPLRFYSEIVVPDELKNLFGRLFSIIDDEDELEQSTAILSKEGSILFSGQKIIPFLKHVNDGIELLKFPSSLFFAVIDKNANMKEKVCENWNISYSSIGGKYRYKKILEERKEKAIPGVPVILWTNLGFDIGIAGCSEKNPDGTNYAFKTDRIFRSINLCSNESAVDYCKKNNCIVYYNDFINNGKLHALIAYTESINNNLQNSYKFRSSHL